MRLSAGAKPGGSSGTCTNAPVNACVIDDTCVPIYATKPDSPCMACRPGISTETYTPFADGLPCSDGDLCTLQDSCVTGECTSSTDKDCDDTLECTADSCDPGTGACTHTPTNAHRDNAISFLTSFQFTYYVPC